MEQTSNDSLNGLDNAGIQPSDPTEPINRGNIAQSSSPADQDECYLMLAQVNLLRIRKQSAAAMVLCETALGRWPYRPDVHALSGDLCQESGRVDDAILRYCRVLELDPKNQPNRQKLTDMVRLKRQSLGPPKSVPFTPRGLRLDRFVRAIILAMATIMLITIMITPVIFAHRKQAESRDAMLSTGSRTINLNPIMLQPSEPEMSTADLGQDSGIPKAIVRDPVEQALVSLMSTDRTLLQLGIQVVDAQEDPFADGCTITFLDHPVAQDSSTKLVVLKNCLAVSQSATASYGSREVRQFTLRCLLLPASTAGDALTGPAAATGPTSLVFEGTIQRSAIPAANSDYSAQTEDQLQSYFTNPWWADGTV